MRTLIIISLGLLIVGCGKQDRTDYQGAADDARRDREEFEKAGKEYLDALEAYENATKNQ